MSTKNYRTRICPDCAVHVGELHEDMCDVARCIQTGGQRLSCYQEHKGDCGEDIWAGEWPGIAECREFGWYAKVVEGKGWVECDKDDPEAHEDLNRLYGSEARWDIEKRRFVQV